MKRTVSRVIIFIPLLCFSLQVMSQTSRILVNTIDSVYELTGGVGNCTYTSLGNFCTRATGEHLFSSALYNDIFYFISLRNNNLYRVKLGDPGSCTLLTSFPTTGPFFGASSLNSLTVDKNGILYAVDYYSNDLYRFNPYTNTKTLLGKVPNRPGGDLIFYRDKLLLSTLPNNIYEINIQDPQASTLYMSTGIYEFYGMISFPDKCDENKVYGFAPAGLNTSLVELDLEARTVIGVVCNLPLQVYDGASIVETGNTIGIQIDSIVIRAPCETSELTGDATIISYSATPGDLTYTVDNSIVNTTGRFEQLGLGIHQVSITNQIGCKKDTFFTIAHGLSPDILVATSDPESCDLQNGTISIQASSYYAPITISVNNGQPQTNNTITGLGAGLYTISISDQGNCRRDTPVVLKYQMRPAFLENIATSPTTCESRSGSINISVNGNAGIVTASLNNGNPQSSLQFNNLDSGYHLLSLFNGGSCRYDTVVHIGKLYDPAPFVAIMKNDQLCFDNNGKVVLQVAGAGTPFSYNFNYNGFTQTSSFDKLAPGVYPVTIRNSNFCSWDTVVEILPYPKQPVNVTVNKTDPNCKELNSGRLLINVAGNEMPYFLEWSGQVYNNGEEIKAPPGEFVIPVLNKDKCAVDSASVRLDLIIEPACDRVSVPNAFTPNNDGRNDIFKPLHSAYINNVVLMVYNRYGQVVFKSTERQPGWNGTFNGHHLDQGTYIWTLTYDDFRGDRKKMKGLVVLSR